MAHQMLQAGRLSLDGYHNPLHTAGAGFFIGDGAGVGKGR